MFAQCKVESRQCSHGPRGLEMRPGASWDAYCPRSLEKETRRRNLRILINVEVHVWNWYLDGYASEEQLRLAHFKVFRCAFCQWMIHAGVLFGRHCKRLLLQRFV